MLKRWIVVGGLGLLLLGITGLAIAQTRSVIWQRWDVSIDNVDTATNRFDVTESHEADFSGTFRFGSRILAINNLNDIRNIRVFENERLLNEACTEQPGTFCVRDSSDGRSITYFFTQPISNRSQVFTIEYTVLGALRVYSSGDQLWWNAIPEEHFGFPIASSQITVNLPPGFGPREGIDPIEAFGGSATIKVSGTRVTATASRQLGGNEGFNLRIQYPHDPNAQEPVWQSNFDDDREFAENIKPLIDLGAIILGVLFLIGGPLSFFGLWYVRGRDPEIGPVPEYLSSPPSDLPPAVVGALIDEKADLRDVLSTLIHLGHRGYLVMEEERTSGVIFGIGKRSEFAFKRTDQPLDELRPFERRIMNRVFMGGSAERSFKSLQNKFYQYISGLQDDLYEELVREKFFNAEPDDTRMLWRIVGGGILVFAAVLFFVLGGTVEETSPSVLFIPFAIGASGLVAFIVSRHMPAKTRKGAEEAAKWKAFREYLRHLDKYEDVELAAEKFDQYLAYAVAFGVDRSWVRRFGRVKNVPIPSWYYPTYMGGPYRRGYSAGSPLPSGGASLPGELARAEGGGLSLDNMSGGLSGGLDAISGGLSEMLNSASSAMTSKPQSSGGSRWGSGGSGWSGGGFSGGGGSGGGSAGFG